MSENRKTTIYHLKPDPPQTCSPDDNAYSASRLMANNRVHCVLVNDNDGVLIGLFTAKDLAFRVVGMGLDPNTTMVKEIMTTTPLCLHMDTPITEALQVMVERGVRHLPLLDDYGSIKGVLDITRCFHQAMLRIERIYTTAQKLNSVLTDVAFDYEDIHNMEAQRIVDDVKRLSQAIEIPSLSSVLDKSNTPSFIDSSDNVATACKHMIQNNTTALLVRDRTSSSRKVIGIFTSKDVCYRVLSRGLDPNSCTIARVLTTSPEFAKSDINIGAALRQMYQGHYLNLPIIDNKTNEIIGIISVLKLTYSALSQLGKSEKIDRNSFGSTTLKEVTNRLGSDTVPIWENFWSSLEKSFDDIHSLEFSVTGRSPSHSRSETPSIASRRSSLNQNFNISRGSSSYHRRFSNDIEIRPETVRFKRALSAESLTRTGFYMKRKSIIFKVNYDAKELHKIKMIVSDDASIYDDIKLLELLRQELSSKLNISLNNYDLFYSDEECDLVSILDESDLIEAINAAGKTDNPIVDLFIKKKSNGGFFRSIWNFLTNWKLLEESSSNILTGTIAVLCMGIMLGFSWTQGSLLWAK